MAVKMRLRRMGAKKAPFYRVIVADERSPRDGKFIDEIGYYNPLTNPADIKINAEKAENGCRTVLNLPKQLNLFSKKAVL